MFVSQTYDEEMKLQVLPWARQKDYLFGVSSAISHDPFGCEVLCYVLCFAVWRNDLNPSVLIISYILIKVLE